MWRGVWIAIGKRKDDSFYQVLRKQYDILDYEGLIRYVKGCSIAPGLKENVAKNFLFYDKLTEEDTYKKLMEGSNEERARWLIENNKYLLLRDSDWMHIFKKMEKDSSAFRRYYPMVRVNVSAGSINRLVIAFVCIDSFYEDAKEWSKKYETVGGAEEK